MNAPNVQLYSEFIKRLSVTTDLFNEHMLKHLADKDLTIAQFGMLNYLFEVSPSDMGSAAGTRLTELTEAVEVQQPAVTKAVSKFQKSGLVKVNSDKADKRTRLVTITEKGKDVVETIRMVFYDDFSSLNAEWTDDELSEFISALTKLCGWLEGNKI